MPTYVVINNAARTGGIVLNNSCFVKLIAAKSKTSAKTFCLENQSVITLSNFSIYERQKIYKALGMTVPQCCGTPCGLNSLNYWRCSTCGTYHPVVKRQHSGKRLGAGRKADFAADRPTCCSRPVNKHSAGRWRCPICQSIFPQAKEQFLTIQARLRKTAKCPHQNGTPLSGGSMSSQALTCLA